MADHCGVGAPPTLVYFRGDWDVHWGVRDVDPWPYGHRAVTRSQGTGEVHRSGSGAAHGNLRLSRISESTGEALLLLGKLSWKENANRPSKPVG